MLCEKPFKGASHRICCLLKQKPDAIFTVDSMRGATRGTNEAKMRVRERRKGISELELHTSNRTEITEARKTGYLLEFSAGKKRAFREHRMMTRVSAGLPKVLSG